MKGMVLAAGFGSRLRPLTDRIPKPLVPVAGHPMIAYPLALLRAAGIRDIVVNLHHLGSQIRDSLGDGRRYGVSIRYSEEEEILETGGGIQKAHDLLGGDRFVVVNGDTVIDLDLREVIEHHERKAAAVTMVLRPDPEVDRYGAIEIDPSDRVRRFLGQPPEVSGPLDRLMFVGVHVLEPTVFDFMEPGVFSITRTTYPRMLAAGCPFFGFRFDGFWRVLDTPAGLAEGEAAVARRGVLRSEIRP